MEGTQSVFLFEKLRSDKYLTIDVMMNVDYE